MPTRVALITPASLLRPYGDSLRVLRQAQGLWSTGFRDFVVYSREPDPALPFEQARVEVRGPLQLISLRRTGCALSHAHQNAGLFLEGRLWADFHGLATLESRLYWRARPLAPRALLGLGWSAWATARLLRKCERVICAAPSIAANLRRLHPAAPPADVIVNCLNPDSVQPLPADNLAVGVIGGFTSRWGMPAFEMALSVARRAPAVPFRMIGRATPSQLRAAVSLPNIECIGNADPAAYHDFLRSISIALLPYPAWCAGGGARQKLLEAAAAGLAVLATPAGVEGFDPLDALCLADSPQALAEKLNGTLADPAERRRRGLALRRHVEQAHHLEREGRRLAELYDRYL